MVSYFLPKSFEGENTPSTARVSIDIQPVYDDGGACSSLQEAFPDLSHRSGTLQISQSPSASLRPRLKVGVLFSGGPAPGGHNVIAGIYSALERHAEDFCLVGFEGGVKGVLENRYKIIQKEDVASFWNRGGFHLLGSGRDKIEKKHDLDKAMQVLDGFDALIIIGGDDSNTNAAIMAQYFAEHKKGESWTKVIGVPKTIDGDLRSEKIETSFGHQSASQLYASLVSAIAVDAASAKKYFHFIRLMGRSASHITLEVALSTAPSVTLIAEWVKKEKMTLNEVVDYLCQVISQRMEKGIFYGTVVIPEGIIESIAQLQPFLQELNALDKKDRESLAQDVDAHLGLLSSKSRALFASLPHDFSKSLLLEPDPHGNLQISKVESERLLASLVERRLQNPRFAYQTHFFGYESRCVDPSPFDSYYSYLLGVNAAYLIFSGLNGVISCIGRLKENPKLWTPQFESLPALVHEEKRDGKKKYVIAKALVDLDGKPFQRFKSSADSWAHQSLGFTVRPIQYLDEEFESRECFFEKLQHCMLRPFDLP